MFQLVRDGLAQLGTAAPIPRTVFAFELKLLEELGQSPDLTDSTLSEGARHLAKTLTQGDWELIRRVKLSDAQIRELRQFLHGFMIYHLERIPPSRTSALNAN